MVRESMIKNSIVLVPFPFDDFSSSKVRPALCLTSEIGEHKHVVIAFISSNNSIEVVDSDIKIEKNSKLWENTGLAVDSILRLHRLVTVPRSIIKRKLGAMNPELQHLVEAKIKKMFELEP